MMKKESFNLYLIVSCFIYLLIINFIIVDFKINIINSNIIIFIITDIIVEAMFKINIIVAKIIYIIVKVKFIICFINLIIIYFNHFINNFIDFINYLDFINFI